MASPVEELLAEARWLEGLALALVGEREAARDLVQDVWVRTLEDPPREVRRPRAWLGRVLRNALSSRRRSESARASRERAHERDGTRGADDVVERAEAQRRLVEAVLALDEPLRKTVLLRFFDGLSSAEIARRQSVPDSTVRTRLAQALELLRERLGRSRTDWRAGLGLIACAERGLECGTRWTPSAKASACVAAAVIGGLWLWNVLLSPARAHPPRLSSSSEPEVNIAAASEPSALGERQVTAPAEGSPPTEAPLAKELFRLRIVALVLAEGSEQPIPHAEVLFADQVVATGDERGRIDQEFVVREDAPREVVRRIQETLLERHATRFVVRAGGWTERDVDLNDRLVGTVHLGVVLLRPASTVAGLVVDEDGAPVPGAGVTWYPGERSPEPREAPYGWTTEREWSFLTPVTVTDAEGRFRLSGVPFVTGFLAAWTRAHAYGYGPIFRLPAGDSPEFTLVLPDLSGIRARIAGIVLDPRGDPLAGARVEVFADGNEELETDDEGRFSCQWSEPSSVALVASDPRGRYGPATLDCPDVQAAQGLVLRLVDAEWLTLEVRGHGRPIPDAKVTGHWDMTNSFGWELGQGIGEHRTDGEGRVRFLRPPGELSFGVEAPGYRLAKGVVAAEEELTEPLVVVLEPARAMRGRLLHGGTPVAGALVHACDSTELSFRTTLVFREENAFDTAYFVTRRSMAARTDAEGRFVVTHGGNWMLTLLVEAEGFPPTTFGPLSAPHPGEREIELPAAGLLEGHVRLPLGARALGRVVGVSNGFSFARTVPLEEDGSYRFASLAPGDYQVRCVAGPSTEWVTFEPYGPERSGPIRFDCRVEANATTRFDVDLRGEGQCAWQVQVVFPSQEERWSTGSLYRLEPDGGATLVGSGGLDAEGKVEFRVATPGRHRFVAELGEGFGSGPTTRLVHEFELVPGESSTRLDLTAGSLRLGPRVGLELAGGPAQLLRIQTTTEQWSASTTVTLLSLQERLIPVPSGRLRLEATHVPFWNQDTVWTPVGELALAPGKTLEPFAPR